MTNKKYVALIVGYLILILGLFFYSFTQIDLNLTLSQAPIIYSFQKFFIQIGYFNRPLSTIIFLLILFLLFLFYFLLLYLVKKEKLFENQAWLLAIMMTIILLFSYPAFSYDLFNYMFDARIFTLYKMNPYQYMALDFPLDPWIRFMHWTHRTYPYGPVFLVLSFFPSFLGFGKFLLTLFNFKLLMIFGYLGSIFLIAKIMEKLNPKDKLFSIVFFAFNPLIIVESLVSGHNDILMLFFTLVSFYLLIFKKRIGSLILLFISSGIKFIPLCFLPLYLFAFFKKKVNWSLITKLMISVFIVFLIPVILQRESYPWYFITVIGLSSMIVSNRFIKIMITGFTLGLLLRYAPFLYFGHYQQPVSKLTLFLTILPLIFSSLIWVAVEFYSRQFSKRKS